MKAVELDALQEKYFISKKRRIELFGERLQKIKDELEKRELKEIPTDKLFELFIKLYSLLKQEDTETIFQRRVPLAEPLDLSSVTHWQV